MRQPRRHLAHRRQALLAPQLLFEPFQFGDILKLRDTPDGLAVVSAQIGQHNRESPGFSNDLPAEGLGVSPVTQQFGQGLADQFLPVHLQHQFGRPIDSCDLGVQIGDQHAAGKTFQDCVQVTFYFLIACEALPEGLV